MNNTIRNVLVALTGTSLATAGTINVGVVTDDNSTGISSSFSYTHAISGGGSATINGVTLAELNTGPEPPGIVWAASGGKNEINPINNNNWIPANGGVTGPGALDMFGGFTFSGGGANPGSTQTFTLTGLTPGVPQQMRLYIRPWDQGGSGRPIHLIFTGAVADDATGPGGLPEDRPGDVLGTGNQHMAYYVQYDYLPSAAGELIIQANVPATAPAGSGSFHLYGLTNQQIPEPSSLALLSLGMLALLHRRR